MFLWMQIKKDFESNEVFKNWNSESIWNSSYVCLALKPFIDHIELVLF